MANEFEGKRYTTIIHRREITNVITGEKTIFGDRYGVYDNEKESEITIPNFLPTCYEDIRAKAHELNSKCK